MDQERRGLAQLLSQHTVRRLSEAGVLDLKRIAAGAAALPWVIGRGASIGVLSQIHAKSRPNRTAIIDRHGELTWKELDQRANQLARGLDDHGVHPGDQVAMLLRNGREFVEVTLGCQKVGVVPAPMNTWAKRRELEGLLDREQPSMLVYDTRQVDQLEGVVPDGVRLVHVGPDEDALPDSLSYERLLRENRGRAPSPFTLDRGSSRILIHTSGTTGTPKTAARSTGGQGAAAMFGVLDTVPYRHDDVIYLPNPLFHAFGILVLAIGIATGGTLVLPDKFDAERAWRDMDEHGVTAASYVPVMLRRLLDADPGDADVSSLRIVLVSGSAMSSQLRDRARKQLGDVLYDLYGSTEAGWVAIATPQTMAEAPDAVGQIVTGVEVRIADDDEILVQSAATFEGYTSGEETDEREGWLATGDLGRLDEDRYLHVVGRKDDMVVVGGENVYPDEIEAVIGEIDDVEDVAVFGVEDEEMGEVLAAFIVGGVSEDEVREVCERELASYKVPRRIEKVDELPRTATGKIKRRELA